MKKTSIILMGIMILCSASSWAQQYHDAELDELKGHVKSYTKLSGGESMTINFTEDGRFDIDGITDAVYNKKGYLVSCVRDFMGAMVPCTITYNSKNQPVKQVMVVGDGSIIQECTYYSDGTVKTEKFTVRAQGMSQSFSVSYTYEAFDSHGSWTRRVMTSGDQSITETRSITYW